MAARQRTAGGRPSDRSHNPEAIADWSRESRELLASFDPAGDFGRRTVLNPEISGCSGISVAPGSRTSGPGRRVPYERPEPDGVHFHRPLSWYADALTRLGCRISELAEPGLDPRLTTVDSEAAVPVPNFVLVAAGYSPSSSSSASIS